MKIFVSSLISGYTPFREAARRAIRTLGHQPIMAEDFPAQPRSSQIACLSGIREADLVLLCLFDRYGSIPENATVSPTHEEFLEARDTKPVLVFVQTDVDREPKQSAFIKEVEPWRGGHIRQGFRTPDDLFDQIIRAIRDHEIANATAPLDLAALKATALAMLPGDRQRNTHASGAILNLAVAGGPAQRLLRPAEIEDRALSDWLQREAMFGAVPVFDRSGLTDSTEQTALVIEQSNGSRIRLDENGGLLLCLPLRRGEDFPGITSVIEETVVERLVEGLAFIVATLEHIDSTQRLAHVAIAASLTGEGGFLAWRTRTEQTASPNRSTFNLRQGEPSPVGLDVRRGALHHGVQAIATDLMVLLRRQRKAG